jgi:hypothetical protein
MSLYKSKNVNSNKNQTEIHHIIKVKYKMIKSSYIGQLGTPGLAPGSLTYKISVLLLNYAPHDYYQNNQEASITSLLHLCYIYLRAARHTGTCTRITDL